MSVAKNYYNTIYLFTLKQRKPIMFHILPCFYGLLYLQIALINHIVIKLFLCKIMQHQLSRPYCIIQ